MTQSSRSVSVKNEHVTSQLGDNNQGSIVKLVLIVASIAGLIAVGVLMLSGESEKIGLVAPIARQDGTLEFPPEVLQEIEKANVDRERVRQSNPQFFDAVSRAMFEHDPIGLNFTTNTDEYEAEAGTVIPRLDSRESASDVVTVLHEEFTSWFGEMTAGDRTLYTELGEDIWALHVKRRSD